MGKFLKYSVGYVKNLPEQLLCPKDIYATRLSPHNYMVVVGHT